MSYIPNVLLNMLVVWLSSCYLCVKWLNVWSDMFTADFGVSQGSVLLPFLFTVYLDDLGKLCNRKINVLI